VDRKDKYFEVKIWECKKTTHTNADDFIGGETGIIIFASQKQMDSPQLGHGQINLPRPRPHGVALALV